MCSAYHRVLFAKFQPQRMSRREKEQKIAKSTWRIGSHQFSYCCVLLWFFYILGMTSSTGKRDGYPFFFFNYYLRLHFQIDVARINKIISRLETIICSEMKYFAITKGKEKGKNDCGVYFFLMWVKLMFALHATLFSTSLFTSKIFRCHVYRM